MKPFKISIKTEKDKTKQKEAMCVPGTPVTLEALFVDFEYNRRCCGKSLEVACHHFHSIEMWEKEETIKSNVPTVHIHINKKDDGIVITTNSLKEHIILPTKAFSTKDEDIQELVMEVYKLGGYEVTKPE